MASTAGSAVEATDLDTGQVLEITRVFDAPREAVWKAWTDPEVVKKWQGPKGFTVPLMEQDVRVGGHWRKHMRGTRPGSSEPVDLWQRGVYREVRPPELLVYTFGWEDRTVVGLMDDGEPHETVVTVRLEEERGKTTMHFQQAFFVSTEERDGHNGGWSSGFERLAELVEGHEVD